MGITVLVTAAAFLIAAAPALAAPANDNFADAQVANTGDTNPTSWIERRCDQGGR